ncbi:MAG: peptidoglycan DD-metalloendopeptidase family protein [Bacilli bacterium]|nr:peptidoglycan DD-metalloendopeptidase family protein [Bacilli bacterium]
MNSYLDDKKRQEYLKNSYSINKKEKKKRLKYIDKLFIRIFFSSICLLLMTLASVISPNNHDKIQHILNYNINFLQISKSINTIFGNNFLNSGDAYVYSQTFYEEVEYNNQVNYISSSTFAGVESLVDGVVIKIEKINQSYNVIIQASDGIIYEYLELESIDVNIYTYVTQGELIGKAKYLNNKYSFALKIKKDNKYISYYENCQD